MEGKRLERVVVARHDDEEKAGAANPQKALLGAKLMRGLYVARRGGACTPVCAWMLEEDKGEASPSLADDAAAAGAGESHRHGPRSRQHHRDRASLAFLTVPPGGLASTVSARELGANLWEIHGTQDYWMRRRSTKAPLFREEKLGESSNISPSGHRKQAIATSTLDFKGMLGSRCRMSMELLKVLNRIWSLEEQHISTISLVTKLKLELENAHARIQELLRAKPSNHHEMNSLSEHIAQDKLGKKNRRQEKIEATVQSLVAKVEHERNLRRHSESMHQGLGEELSELKVAFSKVMKDLDEERKTNNLLEGVCDEFANGVKEYEDVVRELKWKFRKRSKDRCNGLILDFAEIWLDKRQQIELLESQGNLSEKRKMIDLLQYEVGVFLQARTGSLSSDRLLQKDVASERYLCRQSLESIYLNGAGSAPQYAEDGDSVASDLNCFELNMDKATDRHDSLKHNDVLERLEEARNSDVAKKLDGSSERLNCHGSSSTWMRFDGHTQSCNDVKVQFSNKLHRVHRRKTSERRRDGNLILGDQLCQNSESGDQQYLQNIGSGRLLDHVTDDAEFSKLHKQLPEPDQNTDESSDESCELPCSFLGLERDSAPGNPHATSNLAQNWSYHHVSPDLGVPKSSKPPQGKKESTLKAKLMEARLEGQHARLKMSRDSSVCVQ